MTLPLTKTLHPDDYAELVQELDIVDEYFTRERQQHPARRWEYAMALRALQSWRGTSPWGFARPVFVYDVGGAGSPFWAMVNVAGASECKVIDPDHPQSCSLEAFVHGHFPPLRQAVFCLSVLEHVEDLDQFLYHLSCLVAPGGLLFLTMDCCGCRQATTDTKHFHWMRKRIFGIGDWAGLIHRYHLFPTFNLFGGEDNWEYHGDHVYDYSFASLALVKRA